MKRSWKERRDAAPKGELPLVVVKRWWDRLNGWKTLLTNVAVIGIAIAAGQSPDLSGLIDAYVPQGYAVYALGIVNILLRMITNGPVGLKKK